MRINIIHYHLFVGGVTSVILNALQALRAAYPAFSINILCGSRIGVPECAARIAADGTSVLVVEGDSLGGDNTADGATADSTAAANPYTVRIIVHSDLAYHIDSAAVTAKRKRAIGDILRRWSQSQRQRWWVHNYHLGKNPALTGAILQYAVSNPKHTFLLHIHDFPEQGRIPNYRRIKKLIPPPLYPLRRNVHYIAINPIDYETLRGAGIPNGHAHYIPNPTFVDSKEKLAARYAIPAPRVQAIRKILSADTIRAHAVGAPVAPQSKLLIYPVRTIKRKNVLEAMLICASLNRLHASASHAPPYTALAVTLPANSKQHYSYAYKVRALFAAQIVPGLWGIGNALDNIALSYSELIAASDAIISASVQEGFGFTMFEALLARKPFISRAIPTLPLSAPYFAPKQLCQYSIIDCPWTLPLLARRKRRLYRYYISRLRDIAALYPASAISILREQVETMFQRPYIDYSYLTHSLQGAILSNSDRSIDQIIACNGELLQTMRAALEGEFPTPDYQNLIAAYGARQFAQKIEALLASEENENARPTSSPLKIDSTIDDAVASANCTLDYLRAIL